MLPVLCFCRQRSSVKKWWKRVFARIIECAVLNAYVLDSYYRTAQHQAQGRRKRDYLTFRLELAEELIGGFSSRKRAGRRRSDENQQLDRLNIELGHLPVAVQQKLECTVCNMKRQKLGMSRSQFRHESQIVCSVCKVHLCIHIDRNCFQKYHTLVEYWR